MRIDVHHHFPEPNHAGCSCGFVHAIEGLRADVRDLHADLTEFMTRSEVPQDVVDRIGDVLENVSDNFSQEPHDAE